MKFSVDQANEYTCSYGRDITELKPIEQTLSEQVEFERLIADIAATLSQTGPQGLKEVIDTTLQNLGRFLHTERSFYSQFSEDGNHLVFTNTWAAEGLSPRSQIFKLEMVSEIPWVVQLTKDIGFLRSRVVDSIVSIYPLFPLCNGLKSYFIAQIPPP